jgi:hypothetical protein
MINADISRRRFLKHMGALTAVSTMPLSLVELSFADSNKNFTFAYISDAHIQHISGTNTKLGSGSYSCCR